MIRFYVYVFLLVVLSLFLVTGAFGNPMASKTCDVYVNDIRITFPPAWLSEGQCDKMLRQLKTQDETDAKIECKCAIGEQT